MPAHARACTGSGTGAPNHCRTGRLIFNIPGIHSRGQRYMVLLTSQQTADRRGARRADMVVASDKARRLQNGNGKITEIFDDNNNIFSDETLAKRIYGDSANIQNTEDPVPGREQTLQGLRIKLTDTALKGYVLVMYGFELGGNLSVGTEIHTGDVIGRTLNSDICLILIDRDKAVIENIEDYMKVPKKIKNKRTQIDWDFYYWLPYESGPIGEAGTPSDNGAGACATISGPSEIAVGIAQWTVYGSTNNIAPLCKWLAEEDPSLCGSLKAFGSYSSGQFVSDFGSLKSTWESINKKNTEIGRASCRERV